jgi:DNA-binding LacI/PurR family transcriptional regulator
LKRKITNIKDIANVAGVGTTTVSRYLNTPELVKHSTCERIQKVIVEYNYYPSSIAQGMRSNKTKNILLLLEMIESPFFVDILFGAEQCAKSKGYNIFIVNFNKDQNKHDFCKDILFNRNYDGVVSCCDYAKKDEDIFKALVESNIEAIFINNEDFQFKYNTVSTDNYKAAYDGTKYLINKGHKKIALVTCNINKFLFQRREKGFKDALRDKSIMVDNTSIYETDLSIDGGMKIAEKISKYLHQYTAIFCLSDFIALGMLSYFNENNINIPNDISLMGFDDISYAKISTPPLTTIHQKKKKLGYLAVEKLISNMNRDSKSKITIILDTYLVERKSVKDIRDRNRTL